MRPIAAPLTRKTAFRAALCGATAALAVAAGSAAGAAQGEQGPSPARPARDFSTYQPTAKATRIEANEAPTVDGDLSDPIWQKAAPITEFYQVEPVEGADASEHTDVRFLYDENNLYVYVYAYDKRPELVRGTSMNRDGNFGGDDTVRVYLDPLNTRRNAYQFVMNSLGGRLDQLIQNNSDFIREWNTIWTGKSRVVSDGWTVEMAIPFKDLSFDPAKPDWVLEFTREIRHLNERIRWSTVSAAALTTDISRAGTLTGITGIDQGLGLDIQLYGSARYRFDWKEPQRETKSFRGSGNAFYKLTPDLTGTLTVNPDFSDSPLDLLQVNTTRFNLFQPETRNFFLQDTASFEFGGRDLSATNDYNYPAENGSPFFSRNVGLANGVPVSIVAGTKLSGEYAGLDIGALSVVTNGTGDTKHSQVLSVARVTKPIGESKLGFIFTNGDPSGHTENTLAGVDFQYRNSNFQPGKVLRSDLYYVRSFSDTKHDDDSFGAAIDLPNEPFGLETRFKQIGTDYYPALGFENRTGIRQWDGIAQYRRRDLGWRWVDVATSWYAVTGLNNHLESRENGIWAGVALRSTDQIYFRVFDDYEDVPTTFKIATKVPVAPGQYHWTNGSIYIQTSNGRPIFGRLEVLCCHYYGGNQIKTTLTLDMRPNATFQFSPKYVYTHLEMPGGLLDIHAVSLSFITNFSPDMQLYTEAQYDNVTTKLALSVRYRWEYEPGQEIFAAIGQSALVPGQEFVSRTTQAVVRLGHTFRF